MDKKSYTFAIPEAWIRYLLVALATAVIVAPVAAGAGHRFTDVPDTNIFHDDIAWLADARVTLGCNPPANDEFCPKASVTRETMAAFMRRLAKNKVVDAATAVTADRAVAADTATTATHATTADSATTAASADHATTATDADHATAADSATTAGHATTADSANTADHATTAADANTLDGLDSTAFLRANTVTTSYDGGSWLIHNLNSATINRWVTNIEIFGGPGVVTLDLVAPNDIGGTPFGIETIKFCATGPGTITNIELYQTPETVPFQVFFAPNTPFVPSGCVTYEPRVGGPARASSMIVYTNEYVRLWTTTVVWSQSVASAAALPNTPASNDATGN